MPEELPAHREEEEDRCGLKYMICVPAGIDTHELYGHVVKLSKFV